MTARIILQSLVDELALVTLRGDWDGYIARIILPFRLRTGTADLVVSTEADLRVGFDQFGTMLRALHVTDYIRLVRSAHETGPGTIEGEYDNHFVSRGYRVLPPFRSVMTIALGPDDRWRATRIVTELTNTRWPIAIPTPPAPLPPPSHSAAPLRSDA